MMIGPTGTRSSRRASVVRSLTVSSVLDPFDSTLERPHGRHEADDESEDHQKTGSDETKERKKQRRNTSDFH